MRCPETDLGFAEHPVHGEHAQRWLLNSVLALVRGDRGAIDVGAHIGTWTIPLSERFDFVDAFEPQAQNYACLERNAGALENVTLHQIALGAQRGKAQIQNVGQNSGCGYVAPGGDVLVMPLDAYDFVDIDFVKIDVEGYEGHVLAGARRLLDRCKPAIFFEDNGVGPRYFGPKWIDPKGILSDFGYRRKARIEKNELWCYG